MIVLEPVSRSDVGPAFHRIPLTIAIFSAGAARNRTAWSRLKTWTSGPKQRKKEKGKVLLSRELVSPVGVGWSVYEQVQTKGDGSSYGVKLKRPIIG